MIPRKLESAQVIKKTEVQLKMSPERSKERSKRPYVRQHSDFNCPVIQLRKFGQTGNAGNSSKDSYKFLLERRKLSISLRDARV